MLLKKSGLLNLGLILFIFSIHAKVNCFAQSSSASQAQRTEELLEKERQLEEKIQQPEKIYIKNIIVQGASLLDQEKIKEIIEPFSKYWLTKGDIQKIMDAIKVAYQKKGVLEQLVKVSYEVNEESLLIKVEEKRY